MKSESTLSRHDSEKEERSPFAFVSLHNTFGSKRSSSSTSFDNFILATLPVTPINTFFCLFGLFVGGPTSSAILNCIILQAPADLIAFVLAPFSSPLAGEGLARGKDGSGDA